MVFDGREAFVVWAQSVRMAWRAGVIVGLVCVTGLAWASVDINRASEEDLKRLKGIGPATAKRIIAERRRGPYESLEHLGERLTGLGAKRLEKLRQAGLCASTATQPCPSGVVEPAARSPKRQPLATPEVIRLP